ncbi:MAG TPA: alpha/beta fold hydrolase [Streptosporangiaceae bacterium]
MANGQEMVELTVKVADDRDLEVLVIGPSDGLPMVFQHGTPGGVAAYQPMVSAAAQRGLRTVLYARPGYGGSTPQPGRTVAAAAADVAAILDQLGARHFVTVGWSGGGPHALACARLLAGRCLAAASLAGFAPYSASGLDWFAGMGQENIDEYTAALAGCERLEKTIAPAAPQLRGITIDQVPTVLADLASPVDAEAMRGPVAEYFTAMFRSGLRDGLAGWRDDDLAFVSDWGFWFTVPGDAAPISLWHGDRDRMVPFAHGEWLAGHIPGAHTHLVGGAGHLTFPFGPVFDDLLELASGR